MFLIGASCRRTSSGRDKPKSFFIGAHGQKLSVPRHSTLIEPSLWCLEMRESVAHPRALVGTIQASSWSRMMNLRQPLLACNWGQYFTFPASDVWSETTHTFARKATLTLPSMPRYLITKLRCFSYRCDGIFESQQVHNPVHTSVQMYKSKKALGHELVMITKPMEFRNWLL